MFNHRTNITVLRLCQGGLVFVVWETGRAAYLDNSLLV